MSWRETELGELIVLQRGHDLTEGERRPGSIPVIGSAGHNGFHDSARCKGPGLTVGRSGASIGVVTYVKEDFWPHNTALYARDFKGNDPAFMAALLRSIDLKSLNSGSAQPSLNRNFIYPVRVRVPDPDTQRGIAGFLSAYDDLIENNTRRIAILEDMARRLFQEWFGRNGEGREAQAIRIDALIDFDPKTKVPREGFKAFLPMPSVPTNSMVVSELEEREGNAGSKFLNGDTLLARITPCLENGKTAFVDFLPPGEAGFGSTEFIVMRGRSVPPEFVYCLARSEAFREHAIKSMSGATGRQRVSSAAVAQFKMAEPDAQLLDRFGDAAKPMFEMIRSLADANTNLRTTRDLLLPKLVSGEIEVGAAQGQFEAVAA